MKSSSVGQEWQYSTIHNSVCKVIEEQTLWGQTVCRVWLPNQDAVVRMPRSALRPLDAEVRPEIVAGRIAYLASAAKVAEVLEGPVSGAEGGLVLLAPMESNVIPLPHQLHALSRAISGDRVRYLLADEVGLGKTIEAGLTLRELKLRGLVRRTLIVAPKGLATQWVAEMRNHFNEEFQLVLGTDVDVLRRISGAGCEVRSAEKQAHPAPRTSHAATRNPFHHFNQVIVPMDTFRPLDGKYGEASRSRFDDLVTAGWDLVIVDEAHRLGGSTDQVARYKLGKGLAEAAPSILLLSATPHQGKTDAFHRLMNLLDEKAFPDMTSVTRDRVMPYVIRTEKRKAIDADGKPLFKNRITQMLPVVWESRHNLQQLLYEAVTDYVREGYNQAMREKKRHIGFLMILMQRLVVSSTRAIRATLERRLSGLQKGEEQASFHLAELEGGDDAGLAFEDLYDMDGQTLLDELLKSHISALQTEGSHVQTLLEAAVRCEQAGPDAKAEVLIEQIYRLQAEENDPDLKVLIFTEFVPTQEMLKEFLEARGMSVVTLNGSMGMDERKNVQDAFRKTHRVLVSTDAGGEGLNLQFAHVIINYDIPWNPMRLEQRIGRVDRIGQPKVVRAINFVFEDSVEFRVREVLERKLSVIFEEFGIDKTGDVLDSAQAGELFEDLFASAIMNPGEIENSVGNTLAQVRDEMRQVRESSTIYGISEEPNMQAAEWLRSHPLPHWVERMTVNYLKSHGGSAVRQRSWWNLKWPDGREHRKTVFSMHEANRLTGATLINLENNQVRGLAMHLPQATSGQPLPCVAMNDLPANISGFWGLFEIRLQAGMHQQTSSVRLPMIRRGFVCVFQNDEGKVFLPTARHIWDALPTATLQVQSTLSSEESSFVFDQLIHAAENAGQELYASLKQVHVDAVIREEERGMIAFRQLPENNITVLGWKSVWIFYKAATPPGFRISDKFRPVFSTPEGWQLCRPGREHTELLNPGGVTAL